MNVRLTVFDIFKNFFGTLFAIVSLSLILILQKFFAYSQHKNEDHRKIHQFLYHVLAGVDQLTQSFNDTSSEQYTVSFLFTCSQLLIRGSSHILHYGEVMEKLQEAVSYNDQHNLTVSILRKQILMTMTRDFQTQTDFLPKGKIERFYSIFNGGM